MKNSRANIGEHFYASSFKHYYQFWITVYEQQKRILWVNFMSFLLAFTNSIISIMHDIDKTIILLQRRKQPRQRKLKKHSQLWEIVWINVMSCKILFIHFNEWNYGNENIYAKSIIIDSVTLFIVMSYHCQDKSDDCVWKIKLIVLVTRVFKNQD